MATKTRKLNDDTTALDVATPPSGKQTARKNQRPAVALVKANAARSAVTWAKRYTATAVTMSAALNAYANWDGAGEHNTPLRVVAAIVGATIPLLVWMLGATTANTFRAGHRRLAGATASIACVVLALSVIHVAGALAALTGTGYLLAGMLAIGIDCGLVASEATSVLVATE
jgi:hypothetical protein